MMASRLARLLPVGVLGLLFTLGVQPASATIEPLPGTLGNLRVDGDHVTGVLNLRAGQQNVSVDPGMTARLGESEAHVAIVPAERAQRTTVLLIDSSGSMGQSGMATVRSAVKDFLGTAPRDVKVGVVSFGTTAGPEIAPTTDRAAVQRVVDRLRADGETALFEGVSESVAMLGSAGDRSVVLLSDGKNTIGDRDTGLAAAVSALTKAQIRVEVVRFTTGENDPAALAAFAKAGGGSVAQATDAAAVRTAFLAAAKVLESQTWFEITRPPGAGGRLPLELKGTANGRPFVVSLNVNIGSAASATPSSSASSRPAPSTGTASALTPIEREPHWPLVAGLVGVFVAILMLVIAATSPVFRSKRHDRVAQIAQYSLGDASRSARHVDANPSVIAQSMVRMGDKVMSDRSSTSRTMELIQRADLPLRAGEWLVLRVLAVVVGLAATPLVVPLPWWLTVPGGGLLGLFGPSFVLRSLAAKRANKFESMLPDVLMLVATTLASGFSLTQALDAVARDSAEPAGKEFSRALAETRIGADVSDALDHLSVRMSSESMKWTTMAIRIQREVGGNLAETLRTTAQTLRERESLKRQVRALSAEGRLSAYVLIALPIGIFLYMAWVNPAYTALLWTTVPGILMLAVSGLGIVIGSLWLNKVVKIEV